MSKPTPGSVPHPKPSQRPAVPRARPLPLPPHLRHPRIPQVPPTARVEFSEGQQASEAANTRTLWETIIRRKKLVSAIAFGIVVVAGSILGARLKETRQEFGRRKELEEAARRLAEPTVTSGGTDESKTQASNVMHSNESELSSISQAAVLKGAVYDVDVARQIAVLEDRKALLNRQKTNVEQKIARLRERTARREEMEARRPPPAQIDR